MIDLAVVEVDVEIANKQGYINPVVIESTTSERGVGAVHIGNEVELTIMEKVAIIELKIFRIPKLHNAISAVVDVCARN